MTRDPHLPLREHILDLLRDGGAHLNFEKAVAQIPPEFRGRTASPVPHSPWRLLEHLRIAQWDILEFSRNPRHVSPTWPDGYSPRATLRPTRGPGTGRWTHSARIWQ